jgi:hypothetical protein
MVLDFCNFSFFYFEVQYRISKIITIDHLGLSLVKLYYQICKHSSEQTKQLLVVFKTNIHTLNLLIDVLLLSILHY